MGIGPNLEAYCRKCGYVAPENSHSFKCPKCGKEGWSVRGKRLQEEKCRPPPS